MKTQESGRISTPRGKKGKSTHSSARPTSTDVTLASDTSSLDVVKRSKGEPTPVLPPLDSYNDLLSHMEECSAEGAVQIVIKRVQISDVGGQPQYLEILPIFLRGTSLYIFVFKLLYVDNLAKKEADGPKLYLIINSTIYNDKIIR